MTRLLENLTELISLGSIKNWKTVEGWHCVQLKTIPKPVNPSAGHTQSDLCLQFSFHPGANRTSFGS